MHKGALGLLVVCANDRVDERGGYALAENSDTAKETTHKPVIEIGRAHV